MCASRPEEATLGDRLHGQQGGLDAVAAATGILYPDIAQHPDGSRHDVELFADDLADPVQCGAILIAIAFGLRQIMDHLQARQTVRQWLAAAFLTGVFCDDDDGVFCLDIVSRDIGLGLVEQADLIRRELLATGRVALGYREIELFLEDENLRLDALVLGEQLRVLVGE